MNLRTALGLSYNGQAYQGWQSQASGLTIQDHLEKALTQFAAQPVSTACAGRTDAGVHGLNQVVHFDAPVVRDSASWVRGVNRYLPPDIAVQWCMPVPQDFHARFAAVGRRYSYLLLESVVRPALEQGRVGWVFRPLDFQAMHAAAAYLRGEHDFSSFRSIQCQAQSPLKHLRLLDIQRCPQGLQVAGQPLKTWWRFDFEANAFLHHMIRNLMGALLAVGTGRHPPEWVQTVLQAKNREVAAPTFSPEGLYFLGPIYDEGYGIPQLEFSAPHPHQDLWPHP